jgi:hypothetical protein
LADLFGATFDGSVETRMQNSYIDLNPPHPLLRGLEDAGRIINGTARVHTKSSREGVKALMTVAPSYPDLPMEDVYPRLPRTDIPAVHFSDRVVYFPWDIDRTFWEVLAKDHLTLLRNAVDWTLRGRAPVSVTGPGILDITVWRQRASLTVHLVNLTNPMMMKGPIREIYPVGAQKVRLQVPAKPKSVHLCVAGKQIPFRTVGNAIEFEVPSISLHEMVAVTV